MQGQRTSCLLVATYITSMPQHICFNIILPLYINKQPHLRNYHQFKVLILSRWSFSVKEKWVLKCRIWFFMQSKLLDDDCHLIISSSNSHHIKHQQLRMSQRGILQFMWDRKTRRRSVLSCRYRIWSILYSRPCWVKLKKSLVLIIECTASPFLVVKMNSSILLLVWIMVHGDQCTHSWSIKYMYS